MTTAASIRPGLEDGRTGSVAQNTTSLAAFQFAALVHRTDEVD